eukprot:9451490-Pyramimonas_sp.AAC.1
MDAIPEGPHKPDEHEALGPHITTILQLGQGFGVSNLAPGPPIVARQHAGWSEGTCSFSWRGLYRLLVMVVPRLCRAQSSFFRDPPHRMSNMYVNSMRGVRRALRRAMDILLVHN